MKKLFTSLIFCFAISKTVAQSSIQGIEEAPNWPVLLSNLPASQITSGVLYDKVTPFANLNTFNNANNNASKFKHFRQALSELYRASDQTRFITLAELNNRTATTIAVNSVDVGIINTTFEKLYYNEQNPSTTGLLFQNNRFVPITGKPSFLYKKVIVASPLKDIITGSSFSFNFKNNLIFNNATTNIKTLIVDFFDGATPTTIINNSVIITPSKTVNYTTKGSKSLKFTFTFSDNSSIVTYGKIYVNFISNTQAMAAPNTPSNPLPCYEFLKDKGDFTSTLPYKGYDEIYPAYGQTQYTIFYHTMNGTAVNNQKTINQPIIIVDGFDPKDKRKIQDCDCENDPTGDCIKNNDMEDDGFNADSYDSLEDLMNYNGLPASNGTVPKLNLIKELRKKGYDVIVLNNSNYTTVNTAGQSVKIDGGADYIERNAYTLASFMKDYLKVNQVGNAQSVLIGPSMGGQITRYALAYMEKKFAETNDPNWKHNARLWVSVDSPHLGANIPVGAQASIWFFGERLYSEKTKIIYNEELNSVAGKQQILNQLKNAQDNGGILNNSTFFNTYYSNLNSNGVAGSNGYPVSNSSFRKIAMVNGSLTGVKDAEEQQTFLYSRGYYTTHWSNFLISPSFAVIALMQNWEITVLRNKSNFSPTTGQTATVFAGDGQYFNVGLQNWYISHPRCKLNHANYDIKGSLDVVPGGYFKTSKLIKEAIEKELDDQGVESETTDYIENHSFIPTFSALGHLQPYQNWSNPLNTNLTCPSNKQTPFDSYFGTATNTEHTSFTKESIDWLLKELAGQPQAPYFPIQNGLLTGAATLCENQIKTYTIADVCKVPSAVIYTQNGATINGWSVQGNLQIVASTPYSVSVKGTSDVSDEATITATFQNGQTMTTAVHIGAPKYMATPIENSWDWVCVNSGLFPMNVEPNPNATSYYWTAEQDISDFPMACPPTNQHRAKFVGGIVNGAVASVTTPTPNATINWGTCTGVYLLTCYAVNECGMTPYLVKYTAIGKPANNPCSHKVKGLKIAPNPVSSGTTNFVVSKTIDFSPCNYVDYSPNSNFTAPPNSESVSSQVRIFDYQGVEVYSKMFDAPQYVTVKELPKEDETDPNEIVKYEEENHFNIQNLDLLPGFYIISVKSGNEEAVTEHLVVE